MQFLPPSHRSLPTSSLLWGGWCRHGGISMQLINGPACIGALHFRSLGLNQPRPRPCCAPSPNATCFPTPGLTHGPLHDNNIPTWCRYQATTATLASWEGVNITLVTSPQEIGAISYLHSLQVSPRSCQGWVRVDWSLPSQISETPDSCLWIPGCRRMRVRALEYKLPCPLFAPAFPSSAPPPLGPCGTGSHGPL